MKHFVYILFSETANKYYIGETNNLERRLEEHLSHFFENSFTKIAEDWELFLKIECKDIFEARKIERHIKKMKSKKVSNQSRVCRLVKRLGWDVSDVLGSLF